MKIYQVEELVGITKKNIRFYEDEGLLTPERNPENGYRDYTLKDVRQLERIKLLRKLSIPIEEIRLLQQGKLSFSESMNRQIERLEKEQHTAEMIKDFCTKLKGEIEDAESIDAHKYLSEMNMLEKDGSKFMDITKEDINKKKKSGAIIAAAFFCMFLISSLTSIIFVARNKKKAFVFVVLTTAAVGCAIAGTIFALIQRFKEIDKGEEYEARNY